MTAIVGSGWISGWAGGIEHLTVLITGSEENSDSVFGDTQNPILLQVDVLHKQVLFRTLQATPHRITRHQNVTLGSGDDKKENYLGEA